MPGLTPELAVILLNAAIVLLAYGSIYPRLAGSNMQKMSLLDMGASVFALFIVGSKYYGSGVVFSVLDINTNWFWFTLVSYLLLELPAVFWYIKRHGIKLP